MEAASDKRGSLWRQVEDTFHLVAGLRAHSKDQVVGTPPERQKTRKQLIQEAAQAPNIVGEARVLLIAHTLRCHVLCRTNKVHVGHSPLIIINLHLAYLGILEILRGAQVDQDDALKILRPKHILRLNIPVNYAKRVQFLNTLAHFPEGVLGQCG